jgi:putative transposase
VDRTLGRVILTFRYRLLPSKAQHRALEAILESQRQLYNAALEERIGAYRKAGKTLNYFDQCKGLTEWRRSDPEAALLPVKLQRTTLKRLDEAYHAFFRRLRRGGKPGFPRFRGKGWFNSFGIREFARGISFKRGRLRLKGMPGALRVHMHREMPEGPIKSCTFKQDGRGWSIGFALEIEPAHPRRSERAVGIDVGISTFAVLSGGGSIPSLRAARKAEKVIRRAQRALSRKRPASSGRGKCRAALARCHGKVTRQRREHLHQASAKLVRIYDAIAIEKLNVAGLAAGALGKDVRDASWARFISMLRYKAEKAGVRLIEVDSEGTTQDCSVCGAQVAKNLSFRWHNCPACGLSIDRDLNAARNILNRAGVGPGLRNVAGYGMRAGGNLGLYPLLERELPDASRVTDQSC